MSIQLYTSDNLTIVAGKGEQLGDNPFKLIRLHISILVNGKIKSVFQQYRIDTKTGTIIDKDLQASHATYEVLRDLGYPITGFYPIIEEGIEKLYPTLD